MPHVIAKTAGFPIRQLAARSLRLGIVAHPDNKVWTRSVVPKIVPTQDTTRYTPTTGGRRGLIGGASEVVLDVGWAFRGP